MAEYQGPVILSLNGPNMVTIGIIAIVDLLILGLLVQFFMRLSGRAGKPQAASAAGAQGG